MGGNYKRKKMQASSLFEKRMQSEVYQTGRLRRSTLVALRWMAINGQILAIIVCLLILKIELNLWQVLIPIGVSILLNLFIISRTPLDRRVSHNEAGAQLLFDVIQLASLLYLTGGLQNPFALLLLAPVVVSAKTLDLKIYLLLAGSVAILSGLLLFYHQPLPWFEDNVLSLPMSYQIGFWLALLVGMIFTSIYTWRATAQTIRMTEALATTDAILAHETKLSALGGLAAAAAHKLGTPLSTIQLVANEMQNNASNDDIKQDAALIVEQAKRCKNILQELSKRGDKGDIVHDRLTLDELIMEITEPFTGFGVEIITKLTSEREIPVLHRHPEFVFGLTNIVENAVDFATTRVEVICSWNDTGISLDIIDDGPGFPLSILDKIGEPYISYRPNKEQTGGGLGLGVFIASTLIKRVGGSIKFSNLEGKNGAHVKMCWPLEYENALIAK